MTAVLLRATLADLAKIDGKAELIGGRIVEAMPTGMRPSEVASNIYVGLRMYVRQTGLGRAFNDNLGFAIPVLQSGRESFSPDAAYFNGPLPPNGMRFIAGPPTFAVEVRSENDYTPAAVLDQAAKRTDYFQAGTLVVWDVDPVNEAIDCYRASASAVPIRFVRGQTAHAEPAVPGWTMLVEDVFE